MNKIEKLAGEYNATFARLTVIESGSLVKIEEDRYAIIPNLNRLERRTYEKRTKGETER